MWTYDALADRMISNRHARRSAERKPRCLAASRGIPFSHIPILALAVIALAIQMMVVQIHIHVPQAGKALTSSFISLAAGQAEIARDQSSGLPRDKYPVKDDPANCPLCQQVAHSGQFVHSAVILVALPFSVTVNFIVFTEAVISQSAITHIWQGRAPPQA
jgi:hypothetical protein